MKDLINKLDDNRKTLDKGFSNLYETINEIIAKEGGYINTANNDGENDNIYSAIIDFCGSGELVEVMVKAVKAENGIISCYVQPITSTKIIYTDEDIKDDEDNWYPLTLDSQLLYHYTLINLADVFNYEEYLTTTE